MKAKCIPGKEHSLCKDIEKGNGVLGMRKRKNSAWTMESMKGNDVYSLERQVDTRSLKALNTELRKLYSILEETGSH